MLFAPRKLGEEHVGCVVGQEMNGVDDALLRLSMGASSNLSFVLGTPRLILQQHIKKREMG